MRTLARYTAGGLLLGLIAAAFALIAFPHFYSHGYELPFFPVVGLVAGVAVGSLVLLVRAARRRPANASKPAIGTRFLVILLVTAAVVAGLYALRAPARSWKVAPRLVVLCIDGGTWDIIDPLIEAGRLPNLARLKRDGVASDLMSTDPSFSMIAWTTIGTGVQPEKHGIQSFYDTMDNLQAKRFWEVFEESGHSIGLFRWWITWPPRPCNGFVIPDILARDASSFPGEYAFVNQFRSDMKSDRDIPLPERFATAWRFLRSGLRFETCADIGFEVLGAARARRWPDRHVAARRAEIRLNADVYGHLLREFRPEYTCFYDNGVDQMCHFYWQYYEPEKYRDLDPAEVARYGQVIPDYYALHDEVIGSLLEHIDPSASVVVLSDHGFAADSTGAHNWFFPRGVPIVSDLGWDDEYYSLAMSSRTFIYSVRRDPVERRAALERALARVNSLIVDESGVPLFAAWIDEDMYVQLDVSDSLRSLEGHVATPSGLVPLENWFTTRVFGGMHHPKGIFIGSGSAFRHGHKGAPARLIDVAPTVLYAMGFPISRELDGSIVWDWISEAFRAGGEVAWVDTYGLYDSRRRDTVVDEETMKKLRSLGYIR